MQFEEIINISAPIEKVYSLYSDVENWYKWDPDVKNSSIEGAFVTGAKGTLTPTKGPKAKIAFVQIVPGQSFTVESKLPLCTMFFEHEISERDANSISVVHRVKFTGFLAPVFGRLIGSQIKKGLPDTLLGLKKAAENNG